MPYLSPVLNVMISAARKAGRKLIRDFGEVENLQISLKGPADFVSVADQRTERILIEELQKARAGYPILTEESGLIDGPDKSHRFIIDPLDGTTNFLHGIPHFAISIALEREGQLVSAVVYNPVIDDMFMAEKGQGAFLNDRRLRVAARKDVKASLSAQAPIVQKRALAFFGHEHVVDHRIEHDCGDKLPFTLQGNGDGEMRNAVQKIGGAVQRIDNEAVRLVRSVNQTRLFSEDGIAGA